MRVPTYASKNRTYHFHVGPGTNTTHHGMMVHLDTLVIINSYVCSQYHLEAGKCLAFFLLKGIPIS